MKVADPMIIATKNRRLSTPHTVRGLFMALQTGFDVVVFMVIRLLHLSWLREQPSHEVGRPEGHAQAEDDAGENLLGGPLAVSEHQPSDHKCHQRQTFCDRTGKAGLKVLHCCLPWRILGENR